MRGDQRPVGIREVAKEAGVSITTVSHILNGKGSFTDTTKQRVLGAAQALSYQPDPSARSLAGGRTRVIALAFSYRQAIPFPLMDVDYFARAIYAATEQALARDYSLVVGPPTPQSDVWFRLPLDGVIVFDPVVGDPVPGLLRQRGTPMVVVGRDPNGAFDDPCVDNDQPKAIRLALDHLWSQGARRPALFAYPLMDAFVDDCERSYRGWCEEKGIQPIVLMSPPAWKDSPKDVIAELLEGTVRPDSVLALEDDLAVDAVSAAADLGLRVPDEFMAVALADTTSFPGVPITTVELDAAGTARIAVNMLVDLIEQGELEDRFVEIPVRLVQRTSTDRLLVGKDAGARG